MGFICRAEVSDRLPSRSFVRAKRQLKMQARVSRASNFQTSGVHSRSSCRSAAPRRGALTATTPARQRRLDLALLYVANCEPPLSVTEPEDDQPTELEKPVKTPTDAKSLPEPHFEAPTTGDQLENAISRGWMTIGVLAVTLVILFVSYGALEAMTEAQCVVLCFIPFLWDWGNRVADLRKPQKAWRIARLLGRLVLMSCIASVSPYQFKTFIFQYQRGLLPVCGFFGAMTVAAYWLIHSKSRSPPAELNKPDFAFLAPLFTNDISAFTRIERRLSLSWVYCIGVLVLPLLQEILYRGIVVVSQSYFFARGVALLMGALAFNLSQPFDSAQQFLAVLVPGLIWGNLAIIADRNLMYPLVAHMIHNAVLFALFHYQSLLESF